MYIFPTCILIISIILIAFAVPYFGQSNYGEVIKENWYFALLSGFGLFLTYVGFNLLYSKYGVSSYVLYAVLSILTTSIFVGVVLFKESFNTYHWLALCTAIVTVVLFSIGNRVATN